MNLSELATKPQLVEITIDDENIVKKYGEPITFWIYDRQPLDIFFELGRVSNEDELEKMAPLIEKIVLDKDGNPFLNTDVVLPTDVMLKVIEKTVSTLGNAVTQTSET